MTNKLTITTWTNGYRNRMPMWNACFGDYDLGAKVGTGKTEAEAICALIDMAEGDGRQGQEGRVSDRYGEQVR